MSTKYPGGFITKNYVAPTPSSASGIWTLDQQEQAQKAGIWPFGGPFNYIEDMFSTYLYTGTGATQAITNNIDLSTKGGLVWIKGRNAGYDNNIIDTATGSGLRLRTNSAVGQAAAATGVTSFNANGFSLGTSAEMNGSTVPYASWTFRKQPKFFDIQTYTGTGSNRTIAHALGSVPACIMVKRTDTTGNWQVYHRSLANTEYLVLNTTDAKATGATRWNSTTPTSTVFSLGTDATVNASGGTYVAYIFAHDAGGFGLTGTDNVISCGSYTGNGSATGPSVTLGYEPQWVLIKSSTVAGSDWYLMDNMRGMAYTECNELYPNLTAAEVAQSKTIIPTATGFDVATTDAYINNNGSTYIYIAIRRGPMKVPTTGTSVFAPIAYTGSGSAGKVVSGSSFPPDLSIFQSRAGAGGAVGQFVDRLRGGTAYLAPSSTAAEGNTAGYYIRSFDMDGVTYGTSYIDYNANGTNYINWMMKRAPSFFDEVCYTGDGTANRQLNHNLTVTPELIIAKRRSAAQAWVVFGSAVGSDKYLILNTTAASDSATIYTSTSTTFGAQANLSYNTSAATYVAYLFATCAGVSKVGSYTGTGATQTIDCGFGAGGARFVLVKRTDTTGDWYVWDTARGMVSGTDPSLLLNSTAAEVNANSIYTIATGFQIVSTAAGINASGGTYIFLAIA